MTWLLIGPRPPASTSIECVASGVLVDPWPADDVREATCIACGQTVHVGGFPPRYAQHREPAQEEEGQ